MTDTSGGLEQSGAGDEVTREQVQAVIDRTNLVSIELTRYVGKSDLYMAGQNVLRLELDAKTPEFLVTETQILCRFSHRFVALTEDGSKVARIRADHLVRFDLADGPDLSPETIAVWAETNVFFMMYPYLREAVQSMSIRIGLDPIILGVLRRDELRPAGRTELVRSNGDRPISGE